MALGYPLVQAKLFGAEWEELLVNHSWCEIKKVAGMELMEEHGPPH